MLSRIRAVALDVGTLHFRYKIVVYPAEPQAPLISDRKVALVVSPNYQLHRQQSVPVCANPGQAEFAVMIDALRILIRKAGILRQQQ